MLTSSLMFYSAYVCISTNTHTPHSQMFTHTHENLLLQTLITGIKKMCRKMYAVTYVSFHLLEVKLCLSITALSARKPEFNIAYKILIGTSYI